MIECKECGEQFKSNQSLAKHRRFKHNMSLEEYYLKHIGSQGYCENCGDPTTLHSIDKGYNTVCGSMVCACTVHRKRLKDDPERYSKFTNKVSTNMKEKWASGEMESSKEKSTATIRALVATYTTEEKREKFGWINKLSDEDKRDFIQNVMIHTGCHVWWKNATEEDKRRVFNKRTETLNITWNLRGDEIMRKMVESAIKNQELSNQNMHSIDEHTYKSICRALGMDESSWDRIQL